MGFDVQSSRVWTAEDWVVLAMSFWPANLGGRAIVGDGRDSEVEFLVNS